MRIFEQTLLALEMHSHDCRPIRDHIKLSRGPQRTTALYTYLSLALLLSQEKPSRKGDLSPEGEEALPQPPSQRREALSSNPVNGRPEPKLSVRPVRTVWWMLARVFDPSYNGAFSCCSGGFCDQHLVEVYLPLSFAKGNKQEMTSSCFSSPFGKAVFRMCHVPCH